MGGTGFLNAQLFVPRSCRDSERLILFLLMLVTCRNRKVSPGPRFAPLEMTNSSGGGRIIQTALVGDFCVFAKLFPPVGIETFQRAEHSPWTAGLEVARNKDGVTLGVKTFLESLKSELSYQYAVFFFAAALIYCRRTEWLNVFLTRRQA